MNILQLVTKTWKNLTNVELSEKKPNTHKYVPYGSNYIKLKIWQIILLEDSTLATFGVNSDQAGVAGQPTE